MGKKRTLKSVISTLEFTLDDGQKDDDDEEEEGDVKKDTVELIRVTGWVLDLIPNAPSCSHPNIHVEQVTLCKHRGRVSPFKVRLLVSGHAYN